MSSRNESRGQVSREIPLDHLGIPRVNVHPAISILVGIYLILGLLVILAFMGLWLWFVIMSGVITLPWTFFFYSSNRGLLSKDRKTTRQYAGTIQTRNDVLDMLQCGNPNFPGAVTGKIPFYPHKPEVDCMGIPGVMWASSTTYTFPPITGVFTALEESGWKRESVYDLFIHMIPDGAGREAITKVKKRVCRGDISSKLINILHLLIWVYWWLPAKVAKARIWKANRPVVDVDLKDTKWILSGHCLIRPRDKKTLYALGKLNGYLGMWKFVTEEEDLREEGYWQYIVL